MSRMNAFVCACVLIALAAAPASAADADVTALHAWTDAHLLYIRETFGFLSPTGVARALAMMDTCIWDTLAPYTDSWSPVTPGTSIPRRPAEQRTTENRRVAISYAAYLAVKDLFATKPTQLSKALVLLSSQGIAPSSTTDYNNPIGVANVACGNVLSFRHKDGMNQLGNEQNSPDNTPYADYTSYTPINSPQPEVGKTNCSALRSINRWQPLLINTTNGGTTVRKFLAPYMQLVKPFALVSASQFRPDGCPLSGTRSDTQFRADTRQVLTYSSLLDDRLKVIAEFWADGPDSTLPPGHWHKLAQRAAQLKALDWKNTLALLFLQSNAVFDAGIAAWDAKIFFDNSRPITAIQCLHAGETVTAWKGPYLGVGQIDGNDWKPYQNKYFVTPPFAEYVSGHSSFSAASAEVLKRFFGDDTFIGEPHTVEEGKSLFEPKITDPNHSDYQAGLTNVPNSGPNTVGYVPAKNVTLSWKSWTEAADEAGISRLYGGIHFTPGNVDGLSLGRKVGEVVWQKYEVLAGLSSPTTSSAAASQSDSYSSDDVRTQSFLGALIGTLGGLAFGALVGLLVTLATNKKKKKAAPRGPRNSVLEQVHMGQMDAPSVQTSSMQSLQQV